MSVLAVRARWDGVPAAPDEVEGLFAPTRAWAPDGQRTAVVPGAALDFRALRIQDRGAAQGELPYVDEDRGLAVVADARLDNLEDLRRRLGVPSSATMAELLCRAYERWGAQLVPQLVGDFALVIWDWRKRALLAARDAFGVRPLVYASHRGGLVLASDVEQLFAGRLLEISVDPEMMLDHLTWDYRDHARTFFEGARRVPAGHTLVANEHGVEVRRWWRPPEALRRFSGRAEVHEEFRSLFTRAVTRRADVDGAIVAHLSGGADSTSIVCALDRLVRAGAIGGRPVAASAAYPGLEADESPYYRETAAALSFPHVTWDGLAATSLELEHPDFAMPNVRTPLADGTRGDLEVAGPRGARVILSGQSGDEIGASFGLLRELLAHRRIADLARATLLARETPWRVRRRRLRALAGFMAPEFLRGWRGPAAAQEPPAWLAAAARPRWIRRERQALTTHLDGVLFAGDMQRRRWEFLSHPRHAMVVDINQRYAGGSGTEMRFPFLDKELVSFVLAVPFEHWNSIAVEARMHRDALREWLPPSVRGRQSKTHFRSVQVHKIRTLLPVLREIFRSRAWSLGDVVDQRVVAALMEHLVANDDGSRLPEWHFVWSCANLDAWRRHVLGYSSRA
jgi:asparagine synthase (glutamine-hydrolysing)